MNVSENSYIEAIFSNHSQSTIKECYQNIVELIGKESELSEAKKKQYAVILYNLIKE